ncbi:hypothetical protein TSUD_275360 [Trifolium subterraneum]|uniref:Endonuclease/exonuclease/phosphatase domain-containing protein n=1 Tax=Trifolium subterraneum TaxID=3900 RepID=A0A2Z6N4W2_TRISU|nr:hypothetical protein TSUD_275360 [Trifolium subterraneum]
MKTHNDRRQNTQGYQFQHKEVAPLTHIGSRATKVLAITHFQEKCFTLSISRENVLWSHGRFIKSNEEFFLANVYAPCDIRAKQALWDALSDKIQSMGRKRVCVCAEERRSPRAGSRSMDILPFNQFIDAIFLVDLPLSGRNFTWYKGDGVTMSRLDRFLLSEEWCLDWPNCLQVAHLRGLSDHCPLLLTADEDNWGPWPSRMLKCWRDVPGYFPFVRDKWNSFQIDCWGALC